MARGRSGRRAAIQGAPLSSRGGGNRWTFSHVAATEMGPDRATLGVPRTDRAYEQPPTRGPPVRGRRPAGGLPAGAAARPRAGGAAARARAGRAAAVA